MQNERKHNKTAGIVFLYGQKLFDAYDSSSVFHFIKNTENWTIFNMSATVFFKKNIMVVKSKNAKIKFYQCVLRQMTVLRYNKNHNKKSFIWMIIVLQFYSQSKTTRIAT